MLNFQEKDYEKNSYDGCAGISLEVAKIIDRQKQKKALQLIDCKSKTSLHLSLIDSFRQSVLLRPGL